MRGVDHDERENNDDYAAAAATRSFPSASGFLFFSRSTLRPVIMSESYVLNDYYLVPNPGGSSGDP